MAKTIFRYISKEITITLIALTGILLLIVSSNQLVQYLTRAAAGKIPGTIILQLMMLEIPGLLGLLLPLGFFITALIVYGRLYAENEITALASSGFGPYKLLIMTLFMGAILSCMVAVMVLWLNPMISKQRDYVLTGGGTLALIQTIMPGKFHALDRGSKVFYIEDKSRDQAQANNVFMAERSDKEIRPGIYAWDILTASSSTISEDAHTKENFLVLNDGYQYSGVPGQSDYELVKFQQYDLRLPQSQPRVRRETQAMSTKELWPLNNENRHKAAELQWRVSIPIMTLVLSVLVVPLSRSNPRQGRYAKLLPAILIYILYANTLFIARDWISSGQISTTLGVWWLHGSVLALAIGLFLWPQIIQRLRRNWFARKTHPKQTLTPHENY